MINKIIKWITKGVLGDNRVTPMILMAAKYEFEVEKPSHFLFSIVEIGRLRLNAIESLRKLSFNGELKEKSSRLLSANTTATVIEGLIEHYKKPELLRVLKYNSFNNVVLTPYLEIGVIDGKKVLVEVVVPENVRPK